MLEPQACGQLLRGSKNIRLSLHSETGEISALSATFPLFLSLLLFKLPDRAIPNLPFRFEPGEKRAPLRGERDS
jgi:hypothetical protein